MAELRADLVRLAAGNAEGARILGDPIARLLAGPVEPRPEQSAVINLDERRGRHRAR